MSADGWSVVVTAEHGGNDVPAAYQSLFRGRAQLLASHRGWDPGTLDLADRLGSAFGAPVLGATVTRLLVDLNRSPHNPRVFSEVTRTLPRAERVSLIERFHRPHWEAVRSHVTRAARSSRRVLHVAVHSFTPVLDGVKRKPDVAVLYDPSRPRERQLAAAWARALEAALPSRVVRRNDPYTWYSDGLPTALRRERGAKSYIGFELEINQRHVSDGGRFPIWVTDALVETLSEVLA
jgi:predicted N-formylglutamate amidohydrolase